MLKSVPNILVIFLSVATLVAGNSVVLGQTEPLRGTVVTSADHGVKGVHVALRAPGRDEAIEEQTTDDEGQFNLAMENLRPGYEIHFHKDGYNDLVLPVKPQQLVVASIRAILEPIKRQPTVRPTPTMVPTLATKKQREKAVVIYNEGVTMWEEDQDKPAMKKEAMQKIREAASLDPNFVEPIVMLSRFAMRSHSWAEASRYSEAWIRISPDSLEAIGNIYYCMVITRNHQRIGEAIRRQVTLNPDSVTTVNEHAQTYYTNENYLMARAMYEALAEVLVDPTAAYLNLGACCMHLDDPEGTRAAFEAFLDVAPEDHPHRETVQQHLAALNTGEDPE